MGWLTDFVGYSSILTSVLVIACTLAYIPYMLHRMEAITEALKVQNDEFLVLETEARSQLGELRSDYPRIKRATNRKRQAAEGQCGRQNVCTGKPKKQPGRGFLM